MTESTMRLQGGDDERRVLSHAGAELRIEPGGGGPGRLVGYAARFNKDSFDLGGFVEQIRPGAFAEAIQGADIRALKNHDPNLLLGRTSAGTLRLQEDASGLCFTVDLPDTGAGRDVAEEIKRGDIKGCSFSFRIAPNGDEWHEKDGKVKRTIHKVSCVIDVGPVTFPAYPDTSVAARSLEQFRTGAHYGRGRTKTTGGMQARINAANHKRCSRELENAKERQRR